MYSPGLYKYQDSFVLYILTVHAFGSINFTHTLLVQTHTHDVSAPCIHTGVAYAYRNINRTLEGTETCYKDVDHCY